MSRSFRLLGKAVRVCALLSLAMLAADCVPSRYGVFSDASGDGPLFDAFHAGESRSFYESRVAEQADAERYEELALRYRFRLKSHAVDFSSFSDDDLLPARQEWAVPMGVVGDRLAVLTSRCLVDYRYPLKRDSSPDFGNLALFNGEGRPARNVFMLAPIAGRPDLTAARDPKSSLVFDSRHYLEGAYGDRYFGQLVTDRLPRVGVDLVDGVWSNPDGIDLAILYFPLFDPASQSLDPRTNLGIENPLAVVRSAMFRRDEYLGIQFNLVTRTCMRGAQDEHAELERQVKLWRGLAVVAAAAAVFPLLGPLFSTTSGGLAGFAGKVVALSARGFASKITGNIAPVAWQVTHRVLSGQELLDVLWDEGGRLVIGAMVDGIPRKLPLAGIRRGTLGGRAAARVLTTVREFVRDRASLLIQSSGAGSVASIMRPDVGVDLSSELLALGLAALDLDDRQTLARQPSLIRASAHALQGVRGPAVSDQGYQSAVQQLTLAAQ